MDSEEDQKGKGIIPPDTRVLDSNDKPCLYNELKPGEKPNGIWIGELNGKQLYISVFNVPDKGEDSDNKVGWVEMMNTPLPKGWHIPDKDEITAVADNYQYVRDMLTYLDKRLHVYFRMWSATPYADNSNWRYILGYCGNISVSDIYFGKNVGKAFFAL